MEENKTSFISKPPFKKWREYNLWLKATSALLVIQIIVLSFFYFKEHYSYKNLLLKKNILEKSLVRFDEVVRKKNKLLSQQNKGAKYTRRNKNVHEKVASYLRDIEGTLAVGVNLTSFEFTPKKVEIGGYSNSLKNLSDTILNLQKLDFVKEYELEQISKDKKASDDKINFAIHLKI